MNELLAKALEMPEADRAELAYQLLLSLEPQGKDADYDEAWAAEIERRAEQVESGKAQLVEWDKVDASMRKAIEDARKS